MTLSGYAQCIKIQYDRKQMSRPDIEIERDSGYITVEEYNEIMKRGGTLQIDLYEHVFNEVAQNEEIARVLAIVDRSTGNVCPLYWQRLPYKDRGHVDNRFLLIHTDDICALSSVLCLTAIPYLIYSID